LLDDLKETKIIMIENKRQFEDQNREFNGLSARVQSELSTLLKKGGNDKEANLDPKWAEKVFKIEADLDMVIKRNLNFEKKIDDFFLFTHNKELYDIDEKYDELKKEILKINTLISLKGQDNAGLYSPQKTELPIIDDERFNSILEKTKRSIELALSFLI